MKILYFILIIAAAIFYPLFKDDLSFILLVTLLVIPVVLGIMLVFTAKKLRIKVTGTGEHAKRGDGVKLEFQVNNPVPFPVSSCCLNVMYRMSGEKQWYGSSVSFPMGAMSSERIAVVIKAEHCGIVEYEIPHAEIYDLIGLFKGRSRIGQKGRITVFPKQLAWSPVTEEVPARKDESGFINAGKGSDPSWINGLREYTDGDRMNRIHWKLSSRSDNYIVKELGDNYSGKVLLIPDTDACADGAERDLVLDVFFSLSTALLKNTGECTVLSCEDGITAETVTDENELEAQLVSILDRNNAKRELSLTAVFSEECALYASERFAHIVIITPRERQVMLSQIEQSGCAERISVLCTGKKGSIDESRSSDVIVFYLREKGRLEIPDGFIV